MPNWEYLFLVYPVNGIYTYFLPIGKKKMKRVFYMFVPFDLLYNRITVCMW